MLPYGQKRKSVTNGGPAGPSRLDADASHPEKRTFQEHISCAIQVLAILADSGWHQSYCRGGLDWHE